LCLLDPERGTFRPILSVPEDTLTIGSNLSRAIVEDRNGTLWFANWGGGLNRYNESSGTFTRFDQRHGLPSIFIKSMVLDAAGRLWLSTERGVACFDIATERAKAYATSDGLPVMFFFSGAGARGTDGRICFGGKGGVVAFHPDRLVDNPHPPPVVITRLTVFDRPLFRGGYVSANDVSLAHDQDYFGLDFVALDYSSPPRNRYAYILEGFDRDWIDAGTRHYASYTHLPGGTFVFRVRAANSDGVWNNAGTSLRISIDPPYWATWTFRIGCALAAALLLTIAFRVRLRTILEVERLRQRIARDLHDDVGTNLSTIVLASEIARKAKGTREDAVAQMDEIAGTALETQDLMRDIVWMLNPSNDSLGSFVTRLNDTAARVLMAIPFTFESSGVEERRNFDLEVKRNVFLIYKEILNNVIRHAGAASVRITFEQADRFLRVTVHDDGRGFDPAAVKGGGNGLANMKERAAIIGGTLTLRSSPGAGTTVCLEAKIA
jgi:signal transduction histidine kinase